MDKKIINIFDETEIQIISLYLADYGIKLHGRKIARLLASNHRTILLGLQRLEKKGILKQEHIGKNKMYFLNINNIITKSYIEIAEKARAIAILEKKFLLKRLAEELQFEAITLVLFGSYAKAKEDEESDIDILIISDETGKRLNTIANKLREFEKTYHKTIQLQKTTAEQFYRGLKEKDNLVLEIVKSHILLSNGAMFVNFLWRYYYER